MPKTYNTIPTTTTGSVYTAAAHNNIVTNVNNYRVPPCCIVERTGLSVADGANAAVAFTSAATTDTEAPSDPMHSTSVNNTRITARTAGIYVVSGNLQGTAGALANVVLSTELRKNGTVFAVASGVSNVYVNPILSVSAVVSLAASDYIELWYYNDNTTGTAVTVTGRLQAVWVGQVS